MVAPLGLTLILAFAAWLFLSNVEAKAQAETDAQRKLESQARLEAAEIAGAAVSLASEFVETRQTARNTQEQNQLHEAKSVLESVCRHLTLALEKNRNAGTARREAGAFPSGFESLKYTLELINSDNKTDTAKAALEANTPELSSLLPAGYSLSVVEDHAKEMLTIGGSSVGEGLLTTSIARDMIFNDGSVDRRWTLRLEVSAQDKNPLPAAKDVAELLDRRLGGVRPDQVSWRGWLLNRDDSQIAAAFPLTVSETPETLPFINAPGEWKRIDDGNLVWLERPRNTPELAWDIGVSVAVPVQPETLDAWSFLQSDLSWAATLGSLLLASLVAWVWFCKALFSAPAPIPTLETPGKETKPERTEQPKAQRRLVRDQTAIRSLPDNEEVIVAEIRQNGKVSLAPAAAFAAPRQEQMPSGSLQRLQTIHRGKMGADGSRILDHARSPLLREMVKRVRPRQGEAQRTRATELIPKDAAAESVRPLPSFKQGTVSGWNKVVE